MGTFEDNPKGQPTRIPASAWKVLAVLSSLATMVMYAETMLIPALPDLIDEFNVSYSTSSWILSAYLIPGAVMTPIAGKLSDIYGRKKVLLVIMAVYAIGIAMAGFAESIYFLFLSRAIQGIGIAMFVIAFSIIRDQFPRDKISIGKESFRQCSRQGQDRSADRRNYNQQLWLAGHFSCRRTDNHCTLSRNLALQLYRQSTNLIRRSHTCQESVDIKGSDHSIGICNFLSD